MGRDSKHNSEKKTATIGKGNKIEQLKYGFTNFRPKLKSACIHGSVHREACSRGLYALTSKELLINFKLRFVICYLLPLKEGFQDQGYSRNQNIHI